MKLKHKIVGLLLAISLLSGYIAWPFMQPVKIIAIHRDGDYSSILVKNFPLTDRGKITWWLQNKESIKKRYSIPEPASYGSYTIIFWDFGDGYKEEEKYDRLCFTDIASKKNCIEKNKLMTIYKYNDEEPLFSFNDRRYRINTHDDTIKLHNK